jgi:soluble P-type ATPase
MTNLAKVKEHKGLVREMHSKAILNTDEQSLFEHRKNKRIMRDLMKNNEKISELENSINDIKLMLQTILEKDKI